MSLKSNYAFIRDWISIHFLKKEDVDLNQYPTHEEVSDTLESYAEKSELEKYLTVNDYKTDEEIVAEALVDLDSRIGDGVLGQKEEKVIAHALTDLNNRINDREDSNNKVMSISSSSTHDEYPSAKCVYDRIAAIENRLSQLEQNQG